MYLLLLILAGCSRSESFDATGTFEATEVTVSAEASGRILAFNVNEGDRIEQGQTVGTIDTVQLYLQKMQLERQIASVRSNRPRYFETGNGITRTDRSAGDRTNPCKTVAR